MVGEKGLRGKKIGRRVVKALIERAKQLGYKELYVDMIYHYNTGSQRMFESVGFTAYQTTEKGKKYKHEIVIRKKAGRNFLPAFLAVRFYRVMTLSAMCIRSLMSYMLETVPIFCLPSRSKNFKQVPQTRISEPFACRVCMCSTT